jgi:hypothetical protein
MKGITNELCMLEKRRSTQRSVYSLNFFLLRRFALVSRYRTLSYTSASSLCARLLCSLTALSYQRVWMFLAPALWSISSSLGITAPWPASAVRNLQQRSKSSDIWCWLQDLMLRLFEAFSQCLVDVLENNPMPHLNLEICEYVSWVTASNFQWVKDQKTRQSWNSFLARFLASCAYNVFLARVVSRIIILFQAKVVISIKSRIDDELQNLINKDSLTHLFISIVRDVIKTNIHRCNKLNMGPKIFQIYKFRNSNKAGKAGHLNTCVCVDFGGNIASKERGRAGGFRDENLRHTQLFIVNKYRVRSRFNAIKLI